MVTSDWPIRPVLTGWPSCPCTSATSSVEPRTTPFVRAAFLAPGESVTFTDACCVQAAQGGYLEGREQWFFILPLALRRKALNLRGQVDYSKLWPAISEFNRELGLPDRGHLEELLVRRRANLEQYRHRFELQPGQKGALFFLDRNLVGVEIAPNPEYFSDIWMALTAFCYGSAALTGGEVVRQPALTASTLKGLRQQLELRREERDQQLLVALSQRERLQLKSEESYGELQLHTGEGKDFAGQLVERQGQLIYASVCRS